MPCSGCIPDNQGSGILKRNRCIHFVGGILSCGIKSHCRKLLIIFRSIHIGKIAVFCAITDLSHPAAQVCLVNPAVIVCILYICVGYTGFCNPAVFIGYVENSIFPKIFSPAVLADPCPIFADFPGKGLCWKYIIPANHQNVMIGGCFSHITVGRFRFVIPGRIGHSRIRVHIHGRLDGSILVNFPFDLIRAGTF